MTHPQLVAVEGAIILIGLVLVYALIGWPFGGGNDDGGSASADPQVAARPTTLTTAPPTGAAVPSDAPLDDCAAVVDRSFLSANVVVSYYGNPYAETLGILGQHEPDDLVSLLKAQAQTIDDLNGIRGVQPAFHMVYATAQSDPGEDGLYLNHVDPETTQQYINLACQERFMVFLDLQNGRSDPVAEIKKIEPYLLNTNVHVALDPEFTMREGQVPGEVIGHLDAEQINAVQAELERIIEENNLPDKILVLHQFDEGMIRDKADIQNFPHVQIVIDMDGFGPADVKIKKFGTFAQPAENAGIKIFFEQDNPRLTDEEVVALDPDVIIYQ
jgi:hypothetical protein